MSTHTPGPWTWKYGDGFYGPKPTPRGKPVKVATIESDGGCGDPDCCGSPYYTLQVSEEDAHLIAAAPELLAALKALTVLSLNGSQLCFRTKNGIPMGMSKKQERLARAAIAKAEGKGQAA